MSRQFPWVRLAVASALVVSIAAVFGGTLGHGFIEWDDGPNVYANPGLHPVTAASIARFWTAPYAKLYAPLTYTAWSAIAAGAPTSRAEGGGSRIAAKTTDAWRASWPPRIAAWPFHAANLVVHAWAALGVLAILRLAVRNEAAALGGALVFALHPLQVEPVAWVTGLKDVLSGALSLTAVWLYAGAIAPPSSARARRTLATVAFALALLAKPSAVAAPLVAWILERWLRRDSRGAAPIVSTTLVVWVVLAALWLGVTMLAQPRSAFGVISPLLARPLVASDALAFYLGKLVWPASLAVDYGRTPERVAVSGASLLALAGVLAAAAVAWRAGRRAPIVAAGLALFAAGLLPVLGLVPFGFQEYSTVGDRYVYVSLLGPALVVAELLRRVPARAPAVTAPVLCALIAGALGVASVAQTHVWRDTSSLFTRALAVNERSWVAHTGLGVVAAREGRAPDAVAHNREAIRLGPHAADAYYNLGLLAGDSGEEGEAGRLFEEALRRRPEFAEAWASLGALRTREGRHEEAIAAYERALAARPDLVETRNSLGVALARSGRGDEALACFKDVIRADPRNARARNNAGAALMQMGRTHEAIAEFREAVRIDAGFSEAQRNLSRALTEIGERTEKGAPSVDAQRTSPP